MTVRGRRAPGGFTLVEVMVAMVVLSVAAAGLVQLLAQVQQQNARRRSSETALRIAVNEVQRVRSAGPWYVPAGAAPVRVGPGGAPDADGEYRVLVDRQLLCDALSARPNDGGQPPPPCPGALSRIQVRVEHLRGGFWSIRAHHVLYEAGHEAHSGTWTLAGTP